MVQAFYCSPKEAKKLGMTLTTDPEEISRSEAKKLRDLYDLYEAGKAWSVSVFCTIAGGAIARALGAIGFGIASTTAVSFFTDYFESLDNEFDAIATSSSEFTSIQATYKYVQRNGNDGAYFLKKVKVL